jgi:membrane-bound lytic murein transglycosylase B
MEGVIAPEAQAPVGPPGGSSVPLRAAIIAGGTVALVIGLLAFALLRFGGSASGMPLDVAVALPTTAPVSTPQATSGQQRTEGTSRSTNRVIADPSWVARTASRAGVPIVAMTAYADAELLLDAEQPGCHIGWNTLAGIGWIESQHGTIGGRTLLANGYSSTTIVGPALNGVGYAAIRATPASTAWHGDPTWDHAVGPLQFLSSTWNRWGADGDGDGVADPRDINDAALAAARYLCADGHNLSTPAGWTAAVLSYNHQMAYVDDVANAANTYAARTR